MESIITSDGKKMQNFIVNNDGYIEKPQHNVNGILIAYIEHFDQIEERIVLRPVISTLCKDNELSDKLTEAAHNLIPHIASLAKGE
jgi:hypothetical protein